MKKVLIAVSLLLLPLCLSFAQERLNRPNSSTDNRDRFVRLLKLTDEQKKSIESLRFELGKRSVDQQARGKTARLELAEMFKAEQPNQAAIQKKLAEISQLQSVQRVLRVDHWFAVNKLLTPEQQKIWKKASARLWAQQKASIIRGRAAQIMRKGRNARRVAQPPGPMER
ncbi:MAG: periplasmic heavy metal sensor [Ignavibacteriales bacterium]|nr:periplasmic heavy metal sensor [Ignavibacteriales bacterium]